MIKVIVTAESGIYGDYPHSMTFEYVPQVGEHVSMLGETMEIVKIVPTPNVDEYHYFLTVKGRSPSLGMNRSKGPESRTESVTYAFKLEGPNIKRC